ncbi:MAG: T9SS type A sorting domain-containing protein [Bacteroidia bacterium]|nr:T9SS type A sorting domain-containing protein [Bacteroidia bacterium]
MQINKFFLSVVVFFVVANKSLNAQLSFQWAKSNQGPLADEATSVALDALGNVYYAGNFEGVFDLDPGAGTSTVSSAGSKDNFIIKLDPAGAFIWGKVFSGANDSYITDLATDASNNIIVVGNLLGSADFDPSPSTFVLTAPGSSNAGFVTKLDMNGNYVWAKIFSSTTNASASSVEVDAASNVYIGGNFFGTIDLDPGTPIINVTTNISSSNGFICRLNSSGVYLNHYTLGIANYSESVRDLKLDNTTNSLFTTSFVEGQISGTGIYAGGIDVYFEKLNPNLTAVWNKQFGGSGGDYPTTIDIDASGNVYLAGVFNGNCDFDPGTTSSFTLASFNAVYNDIFVSKYNATGNFVWAKQIGSNSLHDYCNGMVVNTTGVYITGAFQGSCDFDPAVTVNNLTSSGGQDMYIAALDLNGNYNFAHKYGSSGTETGISIASDGVNIYTAGYFSNTIDFDFTTGVNTHVSLGGTDPIIHKMNLSSVSVKENNTNNLRFYPNPANEELHFENYNGNKVILNIYDLNRKLIYTFTSSEKNFTISLNKFEKGLYILKQETNGAITTSKLLIN